MNNKKKLSLLLIVLAVLVVAVFVFHKELIARKTAQHDWVEYININPTYSFMHPIDWDVDYNTFKDKTIVVVSPYHIVTAKEQSAYPYISIEHVIDTYDNINMYFESLKSSGNKHIDVNGLDGYEVDGNAASSWSLKDSHNRGAYFFLVGSFGKDNVETNKSIIDKIIASFAAVNTANEEMTK